MHKSNYLRVATLTTLNSNQKYISCIHREDKIRIRKCIDKYNNVKNCWRSEKGGKNNGSSRDAV